MSKKIFRAIRGLTVAAVLITLAVLAVAAHAHLTEEQFERLRDEAQLAAQGVSMNGEAYLRRLHVEGIRVTWLSGNAEILFDSAPEEAADPLPDCEEIREALRDGRGESIRRPGPFAAARLNTALRLEDGSVLRLSLAQPTILSLLLRFALPLAALVIVLLVASRQAASRLSKRVVDPLNTLNLDDPAGSASVAYEELQPLMHRLEDQHRQIERDREELEKTSLIRQEFTANASHELKTPLHVISGYAELLETGMAPPADAAQFAAKIRQESQRMTKLVDDIIDLSRLDGGGVGMMREACDLYNICRSAVESLQQTADEAQIPLRLSGESAPMQGYPQVLYSVVYNLVINAIKYSPAGHPVDIAVRDKPDSAVLTVSDRGIGIPAEDLDRIFERFYRVDKSRSKEVGGTGLGLSIVKHAARLHRAEIHVESELQKGSVFSISFPKQPSA